MKKDKNPNPNTVFPIQGNGTVTYAKPTITQKIIENGIYGLAVGDALGVPYEFLERNEVTKPCTTMIGGGSSRKPCGLTLRF